MFWIHNLRGLIGGKSSPTYPAIPPDREVAYVKPYKFLELQTTSPKSYGQSANDQWLPGTENPLRLVPGTCASNFE